MKNATKKAPAKKAAATKKAPAKKAAAKKTVTTSNGLPGRTSRYAGMSVHRKVEDAEVKIRPTGEVRKVWDATKRAGLKVETIREQCHNPSNPGFALKCLRDFERKGWIEFRD